MAGLATTSSLAGLEGARATAGLATTSSVAGREGARGGAGGWAPEPATGLTGATSCWAGTDGARGRKGGGPCAVVAGAGVTGDCTTLAGPTLASTLGGTA